MSCPCMSTIFVGLALLAVYLLYIFFKDRLAQQKLERWRNTPKDVVVLHGFPASKTVPSASPFILKVQTYMKMAGIAYQMDTKDMFGPKGKAPWISINGQHISDSEFIIEFLNKKFEKNLNQGYSEKQLATASALRIMLDEHFIWGLALERMNFGGPSRLKKVMDVPLPIRLYLKYAITKRSKAQGIGLHSQEEIERIIAKDLRIVSTLLGSNKFICGDEPCEYDAGIFSQLAQCMWGLPDSVYQQLLDDELVNLKEYCLRMKSLFWKDWDQCLGK